MNDVHAFVSFDLEHDTELYRLIQKQARSRNSGFSVIGGSQRSTAQDLGGEGARRRIQQADQVIVICGEHSEASVSMCSELRIAQQENKPYTLLWGRREIMCTKPVGARSSEGMYSWTLPILKDQIDYAMRSTKWMTKANDLRDEAKAERTAGRTAAS